MFTKLSSKAKVDIKDGKELAAKLSILLSVQDATLSAATPTSVSTVWVEWLHVSTNDAIAFSIVAMGACRGVKENLHTFCAQVGVAKVPRIFRTDNGLNMSAVSMLGHGLFLFGTFPKDTAMEIALKSYRRSLGGKENILKFGVDGTVAGKPARSMALRKFAAQDWNKAAETAFRAGWDSSAPVYRMLVVAQASVAALDLAPIGRYVKVPKAGAGTAPTAVVGPAVPALEYVPPAPFVVTAGDDNEEPDPIGGPDL